MNGSEPNTGRRRIIQGAGALAVTAAVGVDVGTRATFGAVEHPMTTNAAGLKEWGRQAGQWTTSLCNMCGGQCGIQVHVVNGVVDKIEPNNWNPTNYTNVSDDFWDGYTVEAGTKDGGRICPKGNSGIMALYDPDRITTPLKRTNPDKSPGADPKFQPITWEQAYTEISAKLGSLRDAGEAHKVLWINEDASFNEIQDDFMALYGSPNHLNHSNLCDVARKASFKSVMGDERPLADFTNAKYVMLFGWNPTAALKWIHLGRIITQGIERGGRLVVVDPRLSDTAAKAQEWVAIRPGTDGAMALAMGHVIVRDKLYDAEFIKTWATGFDQYVGYVADKTPAWAEKITTVPAATIERLAREFATTGPALADVWSGPGHQTNGVQGGRAIALLNALVGTFDGRGGLAIPERNGNAHAEVHPDAAAATTLKQARFDGLEKYPMGHGSGVYTELFANLAEGKGPYKPKVMISVFGNPVMSVPGRANVEKAIGSLEMFVVVDPMLSDSAMMADYVLPGTYYLERYDLITHWVTWSVVGLRQPVVKPIFGQPAEYEFVTELGRRLKLKDATGKEFFRIGPSTGQPIEDRTAWYEDYLSDQLLKGGPAMSLADLKAQTGSVWVSKKGTRNAKYAEPVAAEKLATAWYDGDPTADGTAVYNKAKSEGGKRIGTVFGGRVLRGFFTPTGKVEFFSAKLAASKDANGKAVDGLPVFTDREWMPNPDFPLYLTGWKEATHTHTRTQNNAWLLELKPDNPLNIHPDTAAAHGLADGDTVTVESPHGAVTATVKLTRRMHPEVVGLQHGFGHTALGGNAKGRGTSDSLLRPTKADAISGMAMHKETCVRLKPGTV